MASADGRGRTIFDIIMGRNQKSSEPLELQYHNPLQAKVGCTIAFQHEPDIADINFVIEKICVYKTAIGSRSFYHTDYNLRGISLDHDAPVRLKLRMIPDENVELQIGHRMQLLYLYREMGYDKDLHENVLGDPSGEFWVNHDDDGNELQEPRKYWRIEDVLEPYQAKMTVLKDTDGDGTVEDEELEHYEVTYWDYSRLTDLNGVEGIEFLTVEMDVKSGYFQFLRGTEILPDQVRVY